MSNKEDKRTYTEDDLVKCTMTDSIYVCLRYLAEMAEENPQAVIQFLTSMLSPDSATKEKAISEAAIYIANSAYGKIQQARKMAGEENRVEMILFGAKQFDIFHEALKQSEQYNTKH